jgi:hypothetical protein
MRPSGPKFNGVFSKEAKANHSDCQITWIAEGWLAELSNVLVPLLRVVAEATLE